MAVAIPNFAYRYDRKGKPVFAPSSIGRRIGSEIKEAVEAAYEFDPIYFHLRKGGHVAAMHHHRDNLLFASIDISNFFYSISRRRVQSALDRIGVRNAGFYAKWSTVANPYNKPQYALPYGFVQSPILASLVLATSTVGRHLREALPGSVRVAVYVDDISLSSNNEADLMAAYQSTVTAVQEDQFTVSQAKIQAPAPSITIFNCRLEQGYTQVTQQRVQAFYDGNPGVLEQTGFEAYCQTVMNGNADADQVD